MLLKTKIRDISFFTIAHYRSQLASQPSSATNKNSHPRQKKPEEVPGAANPASCSPRNLLKIN